MKPSRRIAHKVLEDATKSEWDTWRKHYDQLSINDLIYINLGFDAFLREQQCFVGDVIIKVLEQMMLSGCREMNVVELGCHRGGLADECLKHFPRVIKNWFGYDVNYYALEDPIPKDPRYKGMKLTEWFYDIKFENEPNIFVSTSTLEHHNREQFVKIFERLKYSSIRHVAIGLLVRPAGWQGYGGSHVLLMNQEEIKQCIEDFGFNVFYYGRHRVYVWGASR